MKFCVCFAPFRLYSLFYSEPQNVRQPQNSILAFVPSSNILFAYIKKYEYVGLSEYS